MKAIKIELDKSKLEFDKMASDFLRDRDEAFNRAKRVNNCHYILYIFLRMNSVDIFLCCLFQLLGQ